MTNIMNMATSNHKNSAQGVMTIFELSSLSQYSSSVSLILQSR